MLNELLTLSQTLEAHKLLKPTTHPDVNSIARTATLVINLDNSGVPQKYRCFSAKESSILFKHNIGNHNSFPAIRVKKPLLAIGESVKIDDKVWGKASLTEKKELLDIIDFENVNAGNSDIKISRRSLQELEPVLEDASDELDAMRQLIRVFPRSGETTEFIIKLLHMISEKIDGIGSDSEMDLIKTFLLGKRKKDEYLSDTMTFYDMSESGGFENIVASIETKEALIRVLNDVKSESKLAELSLVSALSGKNIGSTIKKYPNPNLPAIGPTYFFSRKEDVPCLTRYGMKGAESYHVGADEAKKLNDAIAFLTKRDQERITWKSIAACNKEKRNLLLAYLTDDPTNQERIADYMTDYFEEPDEEEEYRDRKCAYMQVAKGVLGTEGGSENVTDNEMKLFILEQVDTGRRQVLYENSWTIEQFDQNLKKWNKDSHNYPDLNLCLWEKKVRKKWMLKPIGPEKIISLFKTNYNRKSNTNGKAKVKLPGSLGKPLKSSALNISEIYRLYMPKEVKDEDSQFLEEIMDKALRPSRLLLADIGSEMTKYGGLPSSKDGIQQMQKTANFVTFLSLLLKRMGRSKEVYMEDTAYNLGQFLQLADILHKAYGEAVRGSAPRSLIGGEMLEIAADNPCEAIIRLRQRIKVYYMWAKTLNITEDNEEKTEEEKKANQNKGLAIWAVQRIAEVSEKLRKPPNRRLTAEEQAEMYIGYLAKIKKAEKEVAQTENNTQEEEVNNG